MGNRKKKEIAMEFNLEMIKDDPYLVENIKSIEKYTIECWMINQKSCIKKQ